MFKNILTESTIVIFDLEYTSWEGSAERNWNLPNENREIIQIGATKIKITEDINEIDNFEILVRPTKHPKLSNYFINLTGISQERVDMEGVLFPLALKHFLQFLGDNAINILSNGGDEEIIEENCTLFGISFPIIFNDSINLKPYFSEILGIPERDCTSSMLPELFGLKNLENPHNALGDARAISQILSYLYKKKILNYSW